MNAEHINPFIQGSQRVIETICGARPGLGKIFMKKSPGNVQPATVSISIIGAVQGFAVYSMNLESGFYIVSKMMGGMPITELDPMAQSALCELANIVSGNVATAFSQKGILVDITPPEFFGTSYPPLTSSAVCIPLLLEGGKMVEVDVCVA